MKEQKNKAKTYGAYKKYQKKREASEDYVVGIHPVEEALKGGRSINKILIAKGKRSRRVHEIIVMAKERKLMVQEVTPDALKRVAGDSAHQGVAAYLSPYNYLELSAIQQCQKKDCLVLALNDLTDVHNFGSILRTCDATGVDFVIIPERRSVQVNATVSKTAAGALEHVKIVRVKSLANALKELKEDNFWLIGADAKGEKDYTAVDYSGKTIIVSGAEGKGLSPHIKKICDYSCYIPMIGAINSLNVSVATSLLLYEWRRQLNAQNQ